LAIDPGSEQSAWVTLAPGIEGPDNFGITPNQELLDSLNRGQAKWADVVVIEEIASYGMPVGREVFQTVRWAGRFEEAACRDTPVEYLRRLAVKTHLCHSAKAKDANIRQALLDRFGGEHAKGTKRAPGPLYGVSKDVWAALAVAVAWADGAR
jgi:hypothetical protein